MDNIYMSNRVHLFSAPVLFKVRRELDFLGLVEGTTAP
jgi:hypothetical protein